MSVDHRRFETLAAGKSCALAVLFLSLSNQMSSVVGVGYFNSQSFLLCLLVAVGLVGLLPLFKKPSARLSFAVAQVVCTVIWGALLLYLQSATLTQEVPALVLTAYTFLGRITTLIANMQWNLHLSLNEPGEAGRYAAASVLLGLGLFFACMAVGGLFAQLAMITMLLLCSALNLYLTYADMAGDDSPHRLDVIAADDAAHLPAESARLPIRVLYFGSRVIYGIALGLLVSLAAGLTAGFSPVGLRLAAAFLAVMPVVWCQIGGFTAKGQLSLAVTTPALAFALAYLALSPNSDENGLLCLFALLAEVTWSTQNVFQLPTYRRLCGFHPTVLAFGDYLAQILPYYLCVWVLSSTGFLAAYTQAQGVTPLMVSAATFTLLFLGCTFAMWRHAVRYIPSVHAEPDGSGTAPQAALAPKPSMAAALDALTSREREVFDLVAAGYSRTYIGKALFISPDTVKVHAKHIYAKLGFNSKDDLIKFARGITSDGE